MTSSSMSFCLSGVKDLFFYLTGLTLGSIFNRWVITSERISDISIVDQTKISAFALNRFINCCHSGSDNCDLIWIVFSRLFSLSGIETSCLVGSPFSSFSLWSSLSIDKESSGWLFFTETIKQCQTNCWSSHISLTLFFIKN